MSKYAVYTGPNDCKDRVFPGEIVEILPQNHSGFLVHCRNLRGREVNLSRRTLQKLEEDSSNIVEAGWRAYNSPCRRAGILPGDLVVVKNSGVVMRLEEDDGAEEPPFSWYEIPEGRKGMGDLNGNTTHITHITRLPLNRVERLPTSLQDRN